MLDNLTPYYYLTPYTYTVREERHERDRLARIWLGGRPPARRDRHAGAEGRSGAGASPRGVRQPARLASHERRAVVHARERRPQEAQEQRPRRRSGRTGGGGRPRRLAGSTGRRGVRH